LMNNGLLGEAVESHSFIVKENVRLTGIVVVGQQKRAYFSYETESSRNQPYLFSLTEGKCEGSIELIQVFENEDQVKLRNDGEEMIVRFARNIQESPAIPDEPSQPEPGSHHAIDSFGSYLARHRSESGWGIGQRRPVVFLPTTEQSNSR
jgi:hypothetical protein